MTPSSLPTCLQYFANIKKDDAGFFGSVTEKHPPTTADVMAPFVDSLAPLDGRTMRANFYKCGDNTSHPHWGAWNSIGDELNFHQPAQFVLLKFE